MARIELADLFAPFEIGFGDGHEFVLREATLTAIERIGEAEDKVGELQGATDPAGRSAYADALIHLIDAYLEPVSDGDGKKSYAKTILSRQLKANEIGLDRLSRLALMLQEEAEQRFHPPSPESSDA